MKLRRAVLSDKAALLAMIEAFERHLNAIHPDEHPIRPRDALARAAELLCGPDPAFMALIAERDGVALGYIGLQTILWMDDAAPAVWLSDVFVVEGARGAGVGAALLEGARGHARSIGAQRLVWTVWDRNAPAMAFYGRQGAEAVHGEVLMAMRVGGGTGGPAARAASDPRVMGLTFEDD
ncbi:MAG: GNAT family N-acetyltransferase [Rubrimonas sp.]